MIEESELYGDPWGSGGGSGSCGWGCQAFMELFHDHALAQQVSNSSAASDGVDTVTGTAANGVNVSVNLADSAPSTAAEIAEVAAKLRSVMYAQTGPLDAGQEKGAGAIVQAASQVRNVLLQTLSVRVQHPQSRTIKHPDLVDAMPDASTKGYDLGQLMMTDSASIIAAYL